MLALTFEFRPFFIVVVVVVVFADVVLMVNGTVPIILLHTSYCVALSPCGFSLPLSLSLYFFLTGVSLTTHRLTVFSLLSFFVVLVVLVVACNWKKMKKQNKEKTRKEKTI